MTIKNVLQKNDTIAFIAPSSAIEGDFSPLIDEYNVKFFPSCSKISTDEERLEDLHAAFLDPQIKAIICARGGYGALRLLDKIDYKIISNNPKIFAGSSDVTLLLLMFLSKCNLITYHTQMGENLLKPAVFEDFLNTINCTKTKIEPKVNVLALNKGEACGILWGGNLATLVSLFGSDGYLPKEDIILFLEDINEPVYKIDRMLMQIYRNKRLKEKIKGIVFGEFTGADEKGLLPLLKEFAFVPSFYGYNISHGENNQAIPVGKMAKLNKDGAIGV